MKEKEFHAGYSFPIQWELVRLAEDGEVYDGETIVSNIRRVLWWAVPKGKTKPLILICTDGMEFQDELETAS